MEELDNLKMMSNNDLKEYCEKLENDYNILQKTIKEEMELMFKMSNEYILIKDILNKREGKNG